MRNKPAFRVHSLKWDSAGLKHICIPVCCVKSTKRLFLSNLNSDWCPAPLVWVQSPWLGCLLDFFSAAHSCNRGKPCAQVGWRHKSRTPVEPGSGLVSYVLSARAAAFAGSESGDRKLPAVGLSKNYWCTYFSTVQLKRLSSLDLDLLFCFFCSVHCGLWKHLFPTLQLLQCPV